MNDSMVVFLVICYGFAIFVLGRVFFNEYSLDISFKGIYNVIKFLFNFLLGAILLIIILMILGWILNHLSTGIDDIDNIHV
jgi:hypothetical protein